jgi:2-polyprenyl-6-hydroxyphenyl methylase/3-demethylubiquinone-9 3-methyltransferase
MTVNTGIAEEAGTDNFDAEEVARFSALAADWWKTDGKFAPLHKLNPVRISYIRNQVCEHFTRPCEVPSALSGLNILDVGCGGGLLCEPMARMGASVTGIDPGEANIGAASHHARQHDLDIDYRACLPEELLTAGETFDVVTRMEVVEHVPDVPAFVGVCAGLLKPGGILLLATLNRTLKAYALAIVGAEYILRWLPVGTHQWERFVTPDELARVAEMAGLLVTDKAGVSYNLPTGEWQLSDDLDVNYMLAAKSVQGE